MTQAVELPDDVFQRLDAYGRERGVTPAQAVLQLLEETEEEAFTEAELQEIGAARAEVERGEMVDGPAFFTSLRNFGSNEG